MIFRHFADERGTRHAYLIAEPGTRRAAIVNPVEERLDRYDETLRTLGLELAFTLETAVDRHTGGAALTLCERHGARRVAPPGSDPTNGGATPPPDVEALIGRGLPLGDLQVELVETPRGYDGRIAYRVTHYTFAGVDVLIDYDGESEPQPLAPVGVVDQARPVSAPCPPRARTRPIHSYRRSREGVCLERMMLEDLHTSVVESRLTPKEDRIALAYVRFMEDHDWAPPSASELSALLEGIDRTAIHVLIHNIRWKQIDLGRLPVVLAGQTSKWLKGLQTKPEFTSHEKEFLAAYLRLLERRQTPPSGPEVAAELAGRSVQWVRKRAHTIRAKQRQYGMTELILSRKTPRRPGRPERTANDESRSDRHELEMQYGA